MKKIVFVFLLSFQSLFAELERTEYQNLQKTIYDVMEDEKLEKEAIQTIQEDKIKYELLPRKEEEKKEEVKEEVSLKSLQNEIRELKAIFKASLQEDSIENYVEAEDIEGYIDFDKKKEGKSEEGYLGYINDFTNDYFLSKEIEKNVTIYSKIYNISPELILSLIKVESRFNPTAKSEKGAYGLMQLTEDTAKYLEVERNSISDNIKGGVKLLRELLNNNGNNLSLALASYNAGQGAVNKYGGIPPYPETKNYVTRVLEGMSSVTKNGADIFNDKIEFNNADF